MHEALSRRLEWSRADRKIVRIDGYSENWVELIELRRCLCSSNVII